MNGDMNGKPGMSPDALFCGLVCVAFVVLTSALIYVFWGVLA